MNAEQQEEFLEHMRNGMQRGAAAYAMESTRLAVMDYIATDPEFERRVVDAEEEAKEHVKEAIYQAAVSGSVAAARLWFGMTGKQPAPSAMPAMEAQEGTGDEMDEELAKILRMSAE